MTVLILGGIAESKMLAATLIANGHDIIYSIAGLVRNPQLQCEIHVGGFSDQDCSGAHGLARFCRSRNVRLIIDATHPYAAAISANAVGAARQLTIPCWRLVRPGWNREEFTRWQDYRDPADLMPVISAYRKPFFSIGKSALNFCHLRPSHQSWVVRSARPFDDLDGIIQVNAIGPFSHADELALMRQHGVDALISKNSGCTRVIAKLYAARTLNLPIFVQQRPGLAPADREFAGISALADAIASFRAA